MKFRHTFFFKMLVVFAGVLVATAALTLFLFYPLGRQITTQIKIREMEPVVSSIGILVGDYSNNLIDARALDRVVRSQSSTGQVLVADAQGNIIYASSPARPGQGNGGPFFNRPGGSIPSEGTISYTDYTSYVGDQVSRLLGGQPVRFVGKLGGMSEDAIVVGTPVVLNGHLVGAVLMALPASEADAMLTSISGMLLLSMGIVLVAMLIPIYFLSKRMTNPLRKMQGVALSMAEGDFTARADTSLKGEMGELAGSLNTLSDELSGTITALTVQRNQLWQVIASMSEGILSVDRNKKTVLASPALPTLVPRYNDDLSEIPFDEVHTAFDTALEGKQGSAEIKEGERILELTTAPVLDEKPEVVGAMGLFRDVTERERLEQTRRDYVANVSHELRTPLTAIKGLLDPLADGLVTDEEKKKSYYGILLRETERLTRLINDLLELSRLQANTGGFSRHRVDLNELLMDLRDKYDCVAKERGIRFMVDTPKEQLTVNSNGDRIDQVVGILLSNAFKFTPPGGGVELSLQAGEQVSIRVADTGCGIAPVDLPYVFDRFYKADKAHTGSGTGLGLSIAAEIVKLMQDYLTVESEPGKGTIFTLTFSDANVIK